MNFYREKLLKLGKLMHHLKSWYPVVRAGSSARPSDASQSHDEPLAIPTFDKAVLFRYLFGLLFLQFKVLHKELLEIIAMLLKVVRLEEFWQVFQATLVDVVNMHYLEDDAAIDQAGLPACLCTCLREAFSEAEFDAFLADFGKLSFEAANERFSEYSFIFTQLLNLLISNPFIVQKAYYLDFSILFIQACLQSHNFLATEFGVSQAHQQSFAASLNLDISRHVDLFLKVFSKLSVPAVALKPVNKHLASPCKPNDHLSLPFEIPLIDVLSYLWMELLSKGDFSLQLLAFDSLWASQRVVEAFVRPGLNEPGTTASDWKNFMHTILDDSKWRDTILQLPVLIEKAFPVSKSCDLLESVYMMPVSAPLFFVRRLTQSCDEEIFFNILVNLLYGKMIQHKKLRSHEQGNRRKTIMSFIAWSCPSFAWYFLLLRAIRPFYEMLGSQPTEIVLQGSVYDNSKLSGLINFMDIFLATFGRNLALSMRTLIFKFITRLLECLAESRGRNISLDSNSSTATSDADTLRPSDIFGSKHKTYRQHLLRFIALLFDFESGTKQVDMLSDYDEFLPSFYKSTLCPLISPLGTSVFEPSEGLLSLVTAFCNKKHLLKHLILPFLSDDSDSLILMAQLIKILSGYSRNLVSEPTCMMILQIINSLETIDFIAADLLAGLLFGIIESRVALTGAHRCQILALSIFIFLKHSHVFMKAVDLVKLIEILCGFLKKKSFIDVSCSTTDSGTLSVPTMAMRLLAIAIPLSPSFATVKLMSTETALETYVNEKGNDIAKLFEFVGSLFGTIRSITLRRELVELLQVFSANCQPLSRVVSLIADLNPSNQLNRLDDEMDYERRSAALRTIRTNASKYLMFEWKLLIDNILICLKDDELSIRNSSHFIVEELLELSSSDSLILEIVKGKILGYLQQASVSASISEGVRFDLLALLDKLVRLPRLETSFLPILGSGDIEASILSNIFHIQIHRRTRAYGRFNAILSELQKSARSAVAVTPSEPSNRQKLPVSIISKFWIPLLFQSAELYSGNTPSNNHALLIAEVVKTFQLLLSLLPWGAYFFQMRRIFDWYKASISTELNGDRRVASGSLPFPKVHTKTLLKFLCSGIESFPCCDVENIVGPSEDHSAIIAALDEYFLPKLYDFLLFSPVSLDTPVLSSDRAMTLQKSIRSPIALAIVTLLRKHSIEFLRKHLPKLVTELSQFLRNRSEDIRNQARDALIMLIRFLGPPYFSFFLSELEGSLNNVRAKKNSHHHGGFLRHVLGYTIHSILVKLSPDLFQLQVSSPNSPDAWITDELLIGRLLTNFVDEYFGFLSIEKSTEDWTSKVKEVKSNHSLESFSLLVRLVPADLVVSTILPAIFGAFKKYTADDTIGASVSALISKASKLVFKISSSLQLNKLLNNTTIPKILPCLYEWILRGEPLEAEFSFALLTFLLKQKYFADLSFYLPMLDPFVSLFAEHLKCANRSISDDSQTIQRPTIAFSSVNGESSIDAANSWIGNVTLFSSLLKCMFYLGRMPLPSLKKVLYPLTNAVMKVLVKNKRHEHGNPLSLKCFKWISMVLNDELGVYVHADIEGDPEDRPKAQFSLKSDQVEALVASILPDLEFVDRQNTIFSLIKALISRHYLLPCVYDLMDKIQSLLIVAASASVRQLCRQVFLIYLTTYPLTTKKSSRLLEFFLLNISHDYQEGRHSCILFWNELLRIPASMTGRKTFEDLLPIERRKLFFLQLSLRLIQETEKEVCMQLEETVSLLVSKFIHDGQNLRPFLFSCLEEWSVLGPPHTEQSSLKAIKMKLLSCKIALLVLKAADGNHLRPIVKAFCLKYLDRLEFLLEPSTLQIQLVLAELAFVLEVSKKYDLPAEIINKLKPLAATGSSFEVCSAVNEIFLVIVQRPASVTGAKLLVPLLSDLERQLGLFKERTGEYSDNLAQLFYHVISLSKLDQSSAEAFADLAFIPKVIAHLTIRLKTKQLYISSDPLTAHSAVTAWILDQEMILKLYGALVKLIFDAGSRQPGASAMKLSARNKRKMAALVLERGPNQHLDPSFSLMAPESIDRLSTWMPNDIAEQCLFHIMDAAYRVAHVKSTFENAARNFKSIHGAIKGNLSSEEPSVASSLLEHQTVNVTHVGESSLLSLAHDLFELLQAHVPRPLYLQNYEVIHTKFQAKVKRRKVDKAVLKITNPTLTAARKLSRSKQKIQQAKRRKDGKAFLEGKS